MKEYVDKVSLNSTLDEVKLETSNEITNKINGLKSETWTFTLSNGSTVTKQVVVK